MTGTATATDNARSTRRQAMVAIAFVLMLLILPAGHAASQVGAQEATDRSLSQETPLPQRNEDPDVRVHDPADLLTEAQEERLNADLERLRTTGVESAIFVRDGDDAASASDSLAEDLRLGWGVETIPGADDGIVFVLTVGPDDDTAARIDYSLGRNALPRNGIDLDALEQLLAVDPETSSTLNQYIERLSFAARRLTNTIYDQAGILTERQTTTLHGELQRLASVGVPTVLYIRSAADETQTLSAEDIRVQWGVESSPGADDGLVFMLAVDPRNPEGSTFEVASGANTFPIRQLDDATMEQVVADDVMPNVTNGDEYLGLAFATRRTINYAEYSPPDPPPLSSTQESLQTPLRILAAVLAQVALIGYFLIPVVREGRITLLPGPRSLVEYGIIIGALAIIVGAAGILARNPASSLTGLGVFVWASCGIPVLHQLVTRRSRRDLPLPGDEVSGITQQGGHDVAPAG